MVHTIRVIYSNPLSESSFFILPYFLFLESVPNIFLLLSYYSFVVKDRYNQQESYKQSVKYNLVSIFSI